MSPEEHFDPASGVNALSQATKTMGAGEHAERVIGHYHLLQMIGEGGMGEVWLGEQREPVRRRVAVKLIKAGMNTREVIARFASERQALALMDHPAIAKVFDAGSTLMGAPYFVMEYVAGVPITEYCNVHRLGTCERLELFMHVCEGVQHAHQKAIIHRDLKPSNILVTEVDGKPAPKIIDFGLAKALTQKLTADTLFTRVGAMVGTPAYMSPEQTRSWGEDIDTRTDIYSLGVILYELLAGGPPLDLKKIALDEFLRRLQDEDAPKPSSKILSQDKKTSTDIARERQTEPHTLVKQIRGDLDSITLKALEKDRSRRYGSPSDFAADIARYLNHEPVTAVPPSFGYRAGKFARRYRVPLATACAFVLVLMAATVISVRQTQRANREAAAAKAVNDFLQNDLLAQASASRQSGPGAKPDRDLTVRTALDRAAKRIQGKFRGQPEVEAAIRETIGETYLDLGQYPQARVQLERALDLERRRLGNDNPQTLRTMNRLGATAVAQGKYSAAEALMHKSLESQRRISGPEDPDTLNTMGGLATVYVSQGKYAEAEALYTRVLETRRRVQGREYPTTLTTMGNLAAVYIGQGKYAQAEALYSQTIEIARRVLGPEHPGTLTDMDNLADAYESQGKYAQAEALFSQTIEIARRVLGSEHPLSLMLLSGLADTYQRQGEFALAQANASLALAGERHALGPENPNTLYTGALLALAYLSQGKFGESELCARELVDLESKVEPDNWKRFRAESILGASLAGEKKYAQAEPLLLAGYQGMGARKQLMGVPDWYYLDLAREWIVQLYQSWGKPEKAAEWSQQPKSTASHS